MDSCPLIPCDEPVIWVQRILKEVSKPANLLKLVVCHGGIVLLLHLLNICWRIRLQGRVIIYEEQEIMVWHNVREREMLMKCGVEHNWYGAYDKYIPEGDPTSMVKPVKAG